MPLPLIIIQVFNHYFFNLQIMSIEDESWRENFNSDNNSEGSSREGYRPYNRENTNGNERIGSNGRVLRPRINRSTYGGSSDGQGGRPYRPQQERQGGYQPRPRYNAEGGQGGYPSRRPNGGYGQRRPGGYGQQREGGYGQQREGGYQPRPRYNAEGGQGGYGQQRPRYNTGPRDGYQKDNYQRRGGYGQQRPRRQFSGDYNPNAKYSMKKQIEYKETHIDPDEPIRLNKYLANAGVCSRREADDFISAGVVSVNGQVVTELGTKVKRSDTVLFHDQLVSLEKKVYVLLNKPKDYVTTSDDPQNRKTVMDLVKGACRERIYPVGRLDRNTTGVLLLTNDGELASKLTHPQYLKKKIYHVFLDKNVTAADMRLIADGVTLEDGEIHADAIEYASETDKKQVGIEIHSGRNRVVRRIFESLGYRVLKLDRVYFAGLTKKNVRRGDWRFLTEQEVNMLHMGAFE